MPDALLIRPTIMVIFDAVRDEITVVTPVRPRAGATAAQAYARAVERLTTIVDDLDRPHAEARRDGRPRRASCEQPRSNTERERVPRHGRARQGVHPRRRHLPGRAVAALRRRPSSCRPSRSTARCGASTRRPFLVYLQFDGFSVVCSSPEILVRLRDGKVTIRPIAGTRPRGADQGGGPRARGLAPRRPEGASPSI